MHYIQQNAKCLHSVSRQSIKYLGCKPNVTVKTCFTQEGEKKRLFSHSRSLPQVYKESYCLLGYKKTYSSRLLHPAPHFILLRGRQVMQLRECEVLLCIIINKISRIISWITNIYTSNKSPRGAGEAVGTGWAQRHGLLAALINAAGAGGAGSRRDFASPLSEERRSGIFLSFFTRVLIAPLLST